MRGPLFILSSGRSGSTLLQRVLNTYDHVTVWGEHAGFLAPLADAYFRLLESHGSRDYLFPGTENQPLDTLAALANRKDPHHWQAWMNFVTRGDVTELFRRHIEGFFRHPVMDNQHVWGFKEIRYGRGDRVIEMLHALFPQATFVFLCRDALSTLASQRRTFHGTTGWGRLVPTRDFVAACRAWKTQNQTLRDWHVSGRLDSHWINFESLVATDGAAVRQLFDALGLEFGARQRTVFEMDEGRGSGQPMSGVVDRRGNLGWLPLVTANSIVGKLNVALGYQPVPWLGLARFAKHPVGARNPARAFDGPSAADRCDSVSQTTPAAAPQHHA